MNRVSLVGRLTRDPEISTGSVTIGHYTLAVDRKYKREGGETADFIPCTVFGKSADFARNYLRKGMRIAVGGRIQTGSYTNKKGERVYSWQVIVDEQEFCESKSSSGGPASGGAAPEPRKSKDDFIKVPDNVDDDELPFV